VSHDKTHRLRRALVLGAAVIALSSATTLAFASRRIAAEEAAYRAPAVGRCEPSTLNRSAVLPGTSLAVSPLPDSYYASAHTQISLLGAAKGDLSDVRVNGSETGSHGGRLHGYSQGDGASFVPSTPFHAGETVTVRGRLKTGPKAQPFAYHFTVATQDTLNYVPPAHQAAAGSGEAQRFHTLPGLVAPVLAVTVHSPLSAPGDIFTAPDAGRGPSGPTIFDEAGNLVWFDSLPAGVESTNLQVQQYEGQPVLTWWQGYIPPQGFGEGEEMIYNSSYRQIGRVHAGNGFKADLHDFHLTAGGTALLTVFDPIRCNLSAEGGPSGGAVTDGIFQEVDLRTGLVRREWDSLDHVPLGNSYSTATDTNTESPFDYFHINSIDQQGGQSPIGGTTLLSARNTWALYELNTLTGQVIARIGGKSSTVKLASGAATAFQHDATVQPNGTITVFDNGAVPVVHPQSRALVLSIDPHANTDTVLAQYEHPSALSSYSQGDVQALANGDMFVGWGSKPFFSEFSSSGQLLFDAHLHGAYQTYRAYRFPWTGTPASPPSIAASAGAGGKGPVTVFASWNGDTQTVAWRVLAGPSAKQLAPVGGGPRAGFETAISTPGPEPYVAVQALDSGGAVIGTSPTIKG
jgi:Arylsulfotransferase (ASST)